MREGSRSTDAFHGLVNNHVYALGAAGSEVLAGTLGGVSLLDNGSFHASYTTANSPLTHNWITAIARVDDEWFAGTYGGGLFRLDAKGVWQRFADLNGPIEINPNAMAVTDTHVFAGSSREGCWPSTGARSGGRRSSRAAVDERHRARRRWRPSVRRHRQRARSHPARDDSIMTPLTCSPALVAPIPLLGDAGVLIPSGSRLPIRDPVARPDGGRHPHRQRRRACLDPPDLASHRGGVLEGEYLFSMPRRATVSDFAVWDGVTRIPGVILERRRAEEIYERLKQQQIDPGLLQQGERGTEGAAEATRTSVFSARIVPIPGFGTKRLEIEYHEVVPVENLRSVFALPLRPEAYNAQSATQLLISFSLVSAHAIRDFRVVSRMYPLQIREQTANSVSGSFAGRNVTFSEDFSVEYPLDPAKTDTLEVLTYRNPDTRYRAALGAGAGPASGTRAPRQLGRPRRPAPSVAARPRPMDLDRVETARAIAAASSPSAMSVGALSPEAHQALTIGIQRAGGAANTGEGGEDPAWYAPGPGRRASRRPDQAGRLGAVRRDRDLPGPRRPARDQDRPGLEAGRGRPAARVARRRPTSPPSAAASPAELHQPAAAPRHLLDRGPGPAHRRPAGDQPARPDRRQARRQPGRRHHRGRRRQGRRRRTSTCPGTPAGPARRRCRSIKHVGAPWELGLAEVHQALLRNGLRDRVALRTDGGLQTGRDLLIAALLGAEEFAFGTAALVAIGCDMARQCHLDTCPTGIATQREDLRAKFAGTPEQVERFVLAIAEDLRRELAAVGARSVGEVVGESRRLLRPVAGGPRGARRRSSAPAPWAAGAARRARSGAGRPRRRLARRRRRSRRGIAAALRGQGPVTASAASR